MDYVHEASYFEELEAKRREDSLKRIVEEWNDFIDRKMAEVSKKLDFYKTIDKKDTVLCNEGSLKKYQRELSQIRDDVNNNRAFSDFSDTDDALRDKRSRFNLQCSEAKDILDYLSNPITIEETWTKKMISWIKKNIILVITLVVAVILAFLFKLVKRKFKGTGSEIMQKKANWKSLGMQYHQSLSLTLEVYNLQQIQSLIFQFKDFLNEKPKNLYKKDALEKIRELEIKENQILLTQLDND